MGFLAASFEGIRLDFRSEFVRYRGCKPPSRKGTTSESEKLMLKGVGFLAALFEGIRLDFRSEACQVSGL